MMFFRSSFHFAYSLDNNSVNEDKLARWLILETSGRCGQVALATGPNLCAIRTLDAARRHARDLAPAVGEMLNQQGWRARDLTGAIVSRGPGSYTGLRIGIMSAKAFAYATGAILIAVDTFDAVAVQAPPEVHLLDVIGDAQQEKIYLQQFARRAGNSEAQAVGPLTIVEFPEWLAARNAAAWVSGPGLHRLRARLQSDCHIVDSRMWDPTAQTLLQLGLARHAHGEHDDPYALEPLYLRPSSAEEQWTRRHTP
jgi:tRNA threonylcarbamoyladenosine biosynthesis protein TsaB